MSQKSEKYARNIGNRMDTLESDMAKLRKAQLDSDRFAAAVHTVRIQTATEEAKLRRGIVDRARHEANRANRWRRCTWLAVVALMLCAVLCLTIKAKADAAQSDIGIPITPVEEATVQEDYENAKIEAALLAKAHKIEGCTVTHYAVCVECCGKADGITASGTKATPGVTVAVDPALIPLGSDVLVDYGDGDIQYYRADDTGKAVKGAHIDLCVGSYEEAVQLGVKTATVYWVGPEIDYD